ncbi:MAG: hypothetical protein ACRCZ9_01615 [Fusobacteriaceae bacterium]
MELKEKLRIEFRTLRSSKVKNTGTVVIATQTPSGDILFEMAKLKGFNDNDKPTFDYSNKAIFGLGDIEAAKLQMAMERFLFDPERYVQKWKKAIVFPHRASAKPKDITFTFSVRPNKEGVNEGQMLLSVYQPADSSNFSIYLNEEEVNALKHVLEAQINPALKRVAVEYHRNEQVMEQLSEYVKDGYNFRQFVSSNVGAK